MEIKYGLKLDQPNEKHWVFGANSRIPQIVLQENRDWRTFLPMKEYQNLNGVEPFSCVIFSMLNCVETLIFRKYGLIRNFSDRFLATIVDTRNGGCSPDVAAEFLRTIGVVPQELWPFDESVNSSAEFFRTLPDSLKELAKDFNKEWDFNHEFVPPNHAAISFALKCSPLLISVAAWTKNEQGIYYRPEGMQDNHATTLVYELDSKYMDVFDSYADGEGDPSIKRVDWDSVPMVVKRFWVERRTAPNTVYPWYKKLFRLCR